MKKNIMKNTAAKAVLAAGALALAVCAGCSGSKPAETTAAESTEAAGESTGESAGEEEKDYRKPETFALEEMGTVKLMDYDNMTVDSLKTEDPTETDVDEYISKVLSENPVEITDRAIAEGDTANINYKGSIDGNYFDGGTADAQDLEIGSHSFIDTFEDQLIGAKPGDDVVVNVTFPTDYFNADLAGKPAKFEVHINSIKGAPELDAEFVKAHSEKNSATVPEFRQEIMDKLIAQNTAADIQRAGYDALSKVMEESELQPAAEFVDSIVAEQMDRLDEDLAAYGVTMEDYLTRMNQTQEEFDAEVRTQSEEMAKYYMVYAQIAKDKGIEVTDESMNLLLAEYDQLYGPGVVTIDMLNEEYGEDVVKQIAMEMEISKYLGEHINVNYMTEEEYKAAHPTETEAVEVEAGSEESAGAADAADASAESTDAADAGTAADAESVAEESKAE